MGPQMSLRLAMGTPKQAAVSHFGRLLAAFGLPPVAYELGKAAYDDLYPPAPAIEATDFTFAGYSWTAPPLPPLDGAPKVALLLTAMFVTLAIAWTVCLALERLSVDVRAQDDPRLRAYEWALIGIWALFVVPAAVQPGVQWLLTSLLIR